MEGGEGGGHPQARQDDCTVANCLGKMVKVAAVLVSTYCETSGLPPGLVRLLAKTPGHGRGRSGDRTDSGGLEARVCHRGSLGGRRRRLPQRSERMLAKEGAQQRAGRGPREVDR